MIYREQKDAARLPEEIKKRFYSVETFDHISFFGEIVDAYIIEEN
jgi:hypothetical protein